MKISMPMGHGQTQKYNCKAPDRIVIPVSYAAGQIGITNKPGITFSWDKLCDPCAYAKCNLSCSYCQVSRANRDAKGYDWTKQNLKAAINFIAEKATPGIKIEFQGGEPTLRLDLLRSIIDELNDRLIQPSFVICSNLQEVGDELLDLITLKNVQISCSLDGPQIIHQQNRTVDNLVTDQFYRNFRFIRKNFGDDKISVVSTVADYSTIPQIIDFYFEEKIPELFLRPVNYQGFARKAFNEEAKDLEAWQQAYKSGIEHIFQRNALGSHKLVEATFAIHLSKFFNPSNNGYVDLRPPTHCVMTIL